MISYEEFKKIVAEQFKDHMPEQYQGMKVRIEPCYKVNELLDGIVLVGDGRSVLPTLYVNDLYEHYLDTKDLQEVLRNAARVMDDAFRNPDAVLNFEQNFEHAKDNIIFQIVNTSQNKVMLQDVPNRKFQDLSIIYRWIVGIDETGIRSFVIYNSHAEQFGMNEEQLYEYAMENTRRILPPTVTSIKDAMYEELIRNGVPVRTAKRMIRMIPEDELMWVISNKRRLFGAGSMLYEDILCGLAMRLKADLYILPSSIDECFVVPTSAGDPQELAEMVHEINMGKVDLAKRLSNQVYYYDKDARKLTLATDTPNKRLDGLIDEQWEKKH